MHERVLRPAALALQARACWPFFVAKTTLRTPSNLDPKSISYISNAFRFPYRPQLKESLNKFKGGALWLRELF